MKSRRGRIRKRTKGRAPAGRRERRIASAPADLAARRRARMKAWGMIPGWLKLAGRSKSREANPVAARPTAAGSSETGIFPPRSNRRNPWARNARLMLVHGIAEFPARSATPTGNAPRPAARGRLPAQTRCFGNSARPSDAIESSIVQIISTRLPTQAQLRAQLRKVFRRLAFNCNRSLLAPVCQSWKIPP